MVLFSKDRILVPTDFSEKSLQAIKETIAYADTEAGDSAQVYVVHVLKPLEATEPGVVWESVDNEKRTKTILSLFEEKFPSSEYEGLNFEVRNGDPTAEIIDYAEHQKIDLIVMPSRGRTGISRFFMGSIAERVVRFAHCPVLVLKQ
ncbi:universal stress protein [cf. Phormidesmis sp. LEGE 11477]|uniref:universal stress protein n=1 Tax=cf. Phormidesmis sp. LEGE 11477 TaxID=1828680 RepID=UPI001880F103|nr:universal stress protein [cf. Phormidesmis sp. LEGE 11477]MBE9064359.1 universal stress protein [cf. Phormidesmis sp. LEGE 11477]